MMGGKLPNLELTWQQPLVIAVVLFGTSALSLAVKRRWLTKARPYLTEIGLILTLFAMWQLAGGLSMMGLDRALIRGQDIWNFERAIHLPSEATEQSWIIGHPVLVELTNLYYATLHFPTLIATLIWLYVRHRDRYPFWRNTVVLVTGMCLLIQFIPVAPPRLLPNIDIVDTGLLYGQSVYGPNGVEMANQLAAMPSVHVGWAVLAALAVWTSTTSRWRWLLVAHAIITSWVVAVTANHYWLDGIVAIGLLGLSIGILLGLKRLTRAYGRDSQGAQQGASLPDFAGQSR